MNIKKLLLLCLLVSSSTLLRAQMVPDEWTVSELIYNLRLKANDLNYKYNKNATSGFSAPLNANLYAIKSVLDANYTRLSAAYPNNGNYRQSLVLDYLSLNENPLNNEKLEVIYNDLQVKRDTYNPGLQNNEGHDIPVIVTTYDTLSNKISGYTVYWNFWLDKDNPKANAHFNTFTNPDAEDFLAPGIYDIWVQKNGDNRRYPPVTERTKSIIFLQTSQTKLPVSITIK